MSEQYATIEEHKSLEKRMEDGFRQTNSQITDLIELQRKGQEKTDRVLDSIFSSLNTTKERSIVGDYNMREELRKNNEIRDKNAEERNKAQRANNMKMLSLGVTLFVFMVSTLMFVINAQIKAESADKELQFTKEQHKIELQIQNIEKDVYWCKKLEQNEKKLEKNY